MNDSGHGVQDAVDSSTTIKIQSSSGPLLPVLLFLILIFLLLSGCGYRNPYAVDTANNPVSIHIPMWENQTNIAGLEYTFFEKMHGWFRKNSNINTSPSADQADLILQGSITSLNLPGLSYGQYERVTEGEAQLTVNFSLTRKKEYIWQEPAMVLEEAYLISTSAEKTRNNLNKALARMAEDLAEKVYLKALNSQLKQ